MIIHILKLRLIKRQVKLTLNFGARTLRNHETTVQTCPPLEGLPDARLPYCGQGWQAGFR
jgi:hypothetical protein